MGNCLKDICLVAPHFFYVHDQLQIRFLGAYRR